MHAFPDDIAAGFAETAGIGHGINKGVFTPSRELQGEGDLINGEFPVGAHDVVENLVPIRHRTDMAGCSEDHFVDILAPRRGNAGPADGHADGIAEGFLVIVDRLAVQFDGYQFKSIVPQSPAVIGLFDRKGVGDALPDVFMFDIDPDTLGHDHGAVPLQIGRHIEAENALSFRLRQTGERDEEREEKGESGKKQSLDVHVRSLPQKETCGTARSATLSSSKNSPSLKL
jgi:hypothetical protein